MEERHEHQLHGRASMPLLQAGGRTADRVHRRLQGHDDGSEPSGDLDFTDGSWCHCPACEHEGTVKDFRLYRVFNDTDGIYASEDEMHWERAEEFVEQFHERFKGQGYYRTARVQNIPVEEIRLCLEPV